MIDHVQGNKLSTMTNLEQTIERPKLKLTGTVKVDQTVEKEIDLPYFCQYGGNTFYKVISEDDVIIATTYSFSKGIEVGYVTHNKTQLAKAEPCSERAFIEAAQIAFFHIKNNLHEAIKSI